MLDKNKILENVTKCNCISRKFLKEQNITEKNVMIQYMVVQNVIIVIMSQNFKIGLMVTVQNVHQINVQKFKEQKELRKQTYKNMEVKMFLVIKIYKGRNQKHLRKIMVQKIYHNYHKQKIKKKNNGRKR